MENMITTWTLSEFLAHLRSLDVRLSLDGDRLACSAPKGALTADIRAELQKRKAEILSFLSSAAADSFTPPPILPAEPGSELRLSFPQQRLWFLDRMEPGNPMYNISGAVRMTGTLDQDALERSLHAIIARHDSLRTSFHESEGAPAAVVLDANDWRMNVVSLTALPEEERNSEMLRLCVAEAHLPFDLSHGSMLRATLIVLGPNEYVLTLVMHHIASDGWSLGVFIKELGQLYSAFHSGEAASLPSLQIQYSDYANWHRHWMESGVLEAQIPYWKKTLAAPLATLELPLDRPRPAFQTHNGRRLSFKIPVNLTDSLKQLSRQQNGTLFMTLLAAFQILLVRYSGQEDVIVGTALANRDRPELADLIGFFVNNLVLRTDLSGNPTVRECIERARQTSLDAFAHQEVPFDRLVEVLRPERSLNRSPLFQTMFILQNWPLKDLQLPGLLLSPVEFDVGLSRFDMNVEAIEQENTIRFFFDFNTDLFDASSIRRMQQHYQMLLTSMVENPDSRISDLAMLTPDESKQILVDWNDTSAPFPDTKCVHQLIEDQAARTPDAEAVRYGDLALTYGELMTRANRLANRLRAMGVGPESLIGVCVNRTHEMIVALLAVWKAGGAYVPLDPSYPNERIAFMMEDAKLALLLTEEALLTEIPTAECPVLCLDRDSVAIAGESNNAPAQLAGSRNLAYVIYTSGSTGKPKGVLLEHRSVVNFLTSMQKEPGLTSSDAILSVTTLSFDIAGLEMYLPLIVGARVILLTRAVASDGMLLARTISESAATVMQATPATWRLLLDAGWNDARGLKIFSGGEALPRRLADGLLATGAELWNLYGPTETTIWSTTYRVGPEGDPAPIGRPIANTLLYVLDENLHPVPVNVPGELYIGGDGLARGYLNRPELTAERFVRNPFVMDAKARMYRTGDQVRYRVDGTVEYLGRLDNQVKVRGFRIELGEIESVLATHDRIQDVVVIAREDVPGDQRLVAYVIAKGGDSFTGAPLRAWLMDLLPQYMVPSAFVVLDAFPLTPNGKVDRRALPAPWDTIQETSQSFISPRAGVESAIAEIWRSILHVERVGVEDNFFDLGGHSLLVVQMQSRLRERFNCELSLMELFRRPTVGAIAEYLSEKGAGSSFENGALGDPDLQVSHSN
jgi:amino acid adenylation domain-containing protein